MAPPHSAFLPLDMIFWRGRGYLVPIMYFGWALLLNFSVDELSASGHYWDDHSWPLGVSFLLTSATLAAIWIKTVPPPPALGPQIVQETSGHRRLPKTDDSFWFVPVWIWVYGLVPLGLGVCIWDLFS